MLRPIGNRILIKPEPNADTTESGLILVEDRKPETMGTVVAVGPCAHPLKAEAEDVAERLELLPVLDDDDPNHLIVDAANLLRDVTRRQPAVKAGDLVVFSWTAGREITLNDDERYLMMTEDDILAIIEP